MDFSSLVTVKEEPSVNIPYERDLITVKEEPSVNIPYEGDLITVKEEPSVNIPYEGDLISTISETKDFTMKDEHSHVTVKEEPSINIPYGGDLQSLSEAPGSLTSRMNLTVKEEPSINIPYEGVHLFSTVSNTKNFKTEDEHSHESLSEAPGLLTSRMNLTVKEEPSINIPYEEDLKFQEDDERSKSNQESLYPAPEEFKYSCQHCDYKSTSGDLKRHVIKHSGQTYYCPHCEYSTYNSYRLKNHIKGKHTNERPYSCTYCEYSSVRSFTLKRHMMNHSGLRPYICPQCEYGTTQASHLRDHIKRKHTKERPYSCSHCEYSAVRPGNLEKTHIDQTFGTKTSCLPLL